MKPKEFKPIVLVKDLPDLDDLDLKLDNLYKNLPGHSLAGATPSRIANHGKSWDVVKKP